MGFPATIPLVGGGRVGGCFSSVSLGLIIASKKLDSQTKNHQEIVALAIAKHEIVGRLLSKAVVDNRVSDTEFQLIMTRF